MVHVDRELTEEDASNGKPGYWKSLAENDTYQLEEVEEEVLVPAEQQWS